MRKYSLHGSVIASDLELDAPAAGENAEAEWTIVTGGTRRVPDEAPGGVLLAEFRFRSGLGYAYTQTGASQLFRFYGACDFEVDLDRKKAEVWMDPSSNTGTAALLASGTLISSFLTYQGECVLHASAVSFGDQAVAFIGRSGTGKTTLATLCCASGASLLTDDTLRVAWVGNEAYCFSGTNELRLRPTASSLAQWEHFAPGAVTPTVDQRTGVMVSVIPGMTRLGCLISPHPSRTEEEIKLEPIVAGEALMRLHAFLRVGGWKDRRIVAQQFRHLSRLVSAVPFYKSVVPWGPPFSTSLGGQLLKLGLR